MVRVLARIAAWSVVIAVAVVAAARLWGPEAGVSAYLVAMLPWFTVAAAVAVAVAAIARDWFAAAAGAVVVAFGLAWVAPLFTAAPHDGDPRMTAASVNMRFGEADADDIVALVAEHGVDILSVQELTVSAEQRLADAGLDELLPFHEAVPGWAAEGTGLWTRYPVIESAPVPGLDFVAIRAVLDTPYGEVTAFAVHPPPPLPAHHERWREQIDGVAAAMEAEPGQVLAIGDFNATLDHWPMRELLARGFVDAADQAGAGLRPTFPQERIALALVPIDHAVARGDFVAAEFSTHAITGADHRAIVVSYAGPPA